MKEFFQFYADPVAFFGSLLVSLILAVAFWLRTKKQTRVFALPFFFFGPVLLITCMIFHISENLFHAAEQQMAGTFVFNFRLYSLLFFGIVLGLQARLLFLQCRQHAVGARANWKAILKTTGVIVLISLPTFAFIPIGLVPTIACAITLTAGVFVRKKSRVSLQIETVRQQETALA